MNKTVLKVRCTLISEILGTRPGDPEILKEHILAKARKKHPDLPAEMEEEEIKAMPDVKDAVDEKSTFFPRDKDGNPAMIDFQVKGFFKEACWAVTKSDDPGASGKIKAYRKHIHAHIHVYPRMIPFKLPEEGEIDVYERPLRGQTAQGERVSIARSEMLPIGTTLEFEVHLLKASLLDALVEWLDYGIYKGFLQFRTGGFGRFTYEILNGTKT